MTWADLGAGAGFPGVVLAILLKGRAGVHVHLIDSLAKRCRFLQVVVERWTCPPRSSTAGPRTRRSLWTSSPPGPCAPLDKLLGYAQPYLQRGAQGLFLKGEEVAAELKSRRARSWHFEAQLHPSRLSDAGAVSFASGGLRRAR